MGNNSLEYRDYNLWWRVCQTRHVLFRARNKELSKYGIKSGQASIIFILKSAANADGGMTIGQISRLLAREPHTISSICTRMENAGLVRRSKNGKTNKINLMLTKKGELAYKQSLNMESIKEVMSCLSEEECQQLDSSLKKLWDKGLQILNEPIDTVFVWK